MKRIRLFQALLLTLSLASVAWGYPEKRTALVIGNNFYAAAPLSSPANDAATIAKALEKCNFKVARELNVDSANMVRILSEFQNKLKEAGGIGFFYFAGHAVQIKGSNYLIPIDAVAKTESDVASSGIPLSSVIEAMAAAGNRLNILVLDAAYGMPFGKAFKPGKAGMAEMEPRDGFFIITATQPDVLAEEPSSRKSRFTDTLSGYLTSPETDLKKVFTKVREDVLKSSKKKQEPWLSSPVDVPVYLYYPKLDFFNLLNDVRRYRKTRAGGRYDEVQKAWGSLLAHYPRWSEEIKSEDPIDLIIQALNENLEGSLFEMTRVLNVSLVRTNFLGMDFAYIPPGKFEMGSPFDEPGRDKDEAQRKTIISRGFFMQTTEVTQKQWKAVMGRNPANFDECGPDCPIENVTWHEVEEFIKKLNLLEEIVSYRLPTEAEWEYAARAGNSGWFAFGSDPNKLQDYAWTKDNALGRTHPVGQKKPNDWGLYDIHGNVWEWCMDRVDAYRVVRGGSWFYSALHARSANRFYVFPDDRNYTVGFRLIKSP